MIRVRRILFTPKNKCGSYFIEKLFAIIFLVSFKQGVECSKIK